MENSEDEWHSEELKSEGDSSEFQELPTDQGDLGCKHYRRGCLKQCPNPICEGKYYPCRLCHDEAQESITDPKRHHLFDRHKVT
jgi:RING finger/CHY zinc finger protein 1